MCGRRHVSIDDQKHLCICLANMGTDAASSVLFTELKNGQDSWFLALPLGASAVKQHALQIGHLPSHNGIENGKQSSIL